MRAEQAQPRPNTLLRVMRARVIRLPVRVEADAIAFALRVEAAPVIARCRLAHVGRCRRARILARRVRHPSARSTEDGHRFTGRILRQRRRPRPAGSQPLDARGRPTVDLRRVSRAMGVPCRARAHARPLARHLPAGSPQETATLLQKPSCGFSVSLLSPGPY